MASRSLNLLHQVDLMTPSDMAALYKECYSRMNTCAGFCERKNRSSCEKEDDSSILLTT